MKALNNEEEHPLSKNDTARRWLTGLPQEAKKGTNGFHLRLRTKCSSIRQKLGANSSMAMSGNAAQCLFAALDNFT